MSNLLSLPFEIHILIVRNLNLRDCLAYAQLSPTCHDTVYYIFSHRIELDFSSLVTNNHLIISSELFLDILHAQPLSLGISVHHSNFMTMPSYLDTSVCIGPIHLSLHMMILVSHFLELNQA